MVFGLGMGMALKYRQLSGTERLANKVLRICNRNLRALSGRYLIRIGEMLSNPEARDLLEFIAFCNQSIIRA